MNSSPWQQRKERRGQMARGLNRTRNTRLSQRLLQKIETNLTRLEEFADEKEIPREVEVPYPMPIGLTSESIRFTPYRDYMVRKHCQRTQQAMKNFAATPAGAVGDAHLRELVETERALRKILTLLDLPVL